MKKEDIKFVPGEPAKHFFVKMLTRDIELHDAILDLLDNCVDGVIRSRSEKGDTDESLEGYWAKISFSENSFEIEDNCGGIPWKLAKSYAFKMGRPEEAEAPEGTIGIVGIGMKRAIFKLGRSCAVLSQHKHDTFMVEIPPTWLNEDSKWDFDAHREKPSLDDYGTLIEISDLTEDTQTAFRRSSSFRETFPEKVGEAYSYLIERGFKIIINGERIKARPVKIFFEDPEHPKRKDELIRPFIYEAKIGKVDVFMAVGYRSPLRTEEEQDEDAETSFAAKEAGWTVVCNDRVVLSNDRTVQTGWGFNTVPNFHNQFSCIAGIVAFHSEHTGDLPVTTTKRGVDTGKDIYVLVRQKMQEGLKHFTRNTNRWKGFEKELKKRFDNSECFVGLSRLKHLKLPMAQISGNGRQYKPDLPVKVKIDTTRRISFRKELADIERVSDFLFEEQRTPDEVGERCFNKMLEAARK